MTPIQIEHRKLDLGLGNTDIAERLKAAGRDISPIYVGMILKGERTGYTHRAAIAKILKLKVSDIWGTKKRSGKSRRKLTS
jgi:hypothetical protein